MNKFRLLQLVFMVGLFFISCSTEDSPQKTPCKIASPKNNEMVEKGIVTPIIVEFDGITEMIKEVQFYVDDIHIFTSTTSPFNGSWDNSDADYGIHKVKIIAFDKSETISQDEISIDLIGAASLSDFIVNESIIEDGTNVTFTDLSKNDPIRWEWDFGDGETSNEKNPEHIYSIGNDYEMEKTFSVSLITENEWGADTIKKENYITVKANDLTGETGTLIDQDGNSYTWVGIGKQAWMAENLNATSYPDGTPIPLIEENDIWRELGDNNTEGAYCYRNNVTTVINGALYTYASAVNVCPEGWHLPSVKEWETLESFISYRDHWVEALRAKSGWLGNHTNGAGNGTDIYGFSAKPSGYRSQEGLFSSSTFMFWLSDEHSETNAKNRQLDVDIYKKNFYKSAGLSVRCIRD